MSQPKACRKEGPLNIYNIYIIYIWQYNVEFAIRLEAIALRLKAIASADPSCSVSASGAPELRCRQLDSDSVDIQRSDPFFAIPI